MKSNNIKALFIGGIKSGKSLNAEKYTLKHSTTKPIYLATTEFIDEEMQKRVDSHKNNRADNFITIEEPLKIYEKISTCAVSDSEEVPLGCQDIVLVECVSMWINNMLYHNFNFVDIQNEIEAILKLDKSVVFVLNDVGSGIIPDNKLAREFIDISGKISQIIANKCDEVYHTIAGISTKIK